jgi:hypothetical protein
VTPQDTRSNQAHGRSYWVDPAIAFLYPTNHLPGYLMEQENRQEQFIRFGEVVGLDINAVQAWELLSHNVGSRLILYLRGGEIIVHAGKVGDEAFLSLHRALLDQFPLDIM